MSFDYAIGILNARRVYLERDRNITNYISASPELHEQLCNKKIAELEKAIEILEEAQDEKEGIPWHKYKSW